MSVMKVIRGEVYMCDLKEGIGSEQAKNRPVVIIQNNIGNLHSPTTIVAVTTSQKKKEYPMHVKVSKGIGGFFEDSEILLEQIETIDKARLLYRMGTLSSESSIMNEINKAIRVSLGL